MATTEPLYSAPIFIALTQTNLATATYRQSAAVSNVGDLFVDAHVGGLIQTGTNPVVGTLIVFYAWADINGTYRTAGANGTDSVYTANGNEVLLRRIASIRVNATSNTEYIWGCASVAGALGLLTLPREWGVVVQNLTTVATHVTGANNFLAYRGIKFTSN